MYVDYTIIICYNCTYISAIIVKEVINLIDCLNREGVFNEKKRKVFTKECIMELEKTLEKFKTEHLTKERSLCFSGHRSEKLPQNKAELEVLRNLLCAEINKAIQDGITTFYHGGCYGFDLLAAEIVEQRKRVIKLDNPNILKLITTVPFEGQADDWNEDDRELYFELLGKSTQVITLHTKFKIGCYHERNRYMVDRSSRLICYCADNKGGTKYTLDYAKKNELKIINLYDKMDR